MNRKQCGALGTLLFLLLLPGLCLAQDQDPVVAQLPVEHPECIFFAPQLRAKFVGTTGMARYRAMSNLTASVVSQLPPQQDAGNPPAAAPTLPFVPGGSRTDEQQKLNQMGPIDRYIFSALQQANVTPAPKTSDAEFIRRVTLDLTGRIPAPDRVVSFLADTTPDKRARFVEELLAKPEWADKWTMYFGDLFTNAQRTTQVQRYEEGRNAFYHWINDSLKTGKPYDQMAREIINVQSSDTSVAQSSFTQGQIGWLVGGVLTGGVPVQDTFDQQAANVAETFLGIAHMNCLLCHNGAGHLTTLSLWGSQGKRYQAWQFSSFLSRTNTQNTPVPGVANRQWWSLLDTRPTDYSLNTTTGNRPARQPSATPDNVLREAPVYWFSGRGPARNENYRVALAREVTSDFQFARATVNYIWKEFFGLGIVDPTNQFDPARLDPDNPPPAPWTLQPSNARLLNALAQDFVSSGYDLKALMREIVNSNTYQLSSRYNGTWNPAWEPLFARKMVRRLWAEEIHDAVVQASNIIPSYTIQSNNPVVVFGTVSYAMQFPDTDGNQNNGAISPFLDAFLRGNRIDYERSDDGSLLQALGLMNDNFVMTRTRSSGSGATASLLNRNLGLPDDQLVTNLFLAVLSRYPTATEMSKALANLKAGNRTQEAENQLWLLYNKVDFIYNY